MDNLELLDFTNDVPTDNSIGTKFRMIRTWLKLSQDMFAKAICINSRITVVKIEKAVVIGDISTDTLYRLYYFLVKMVERFDGYEDFFTDLVRNVCESVDSELSLRVSRFRQNQDGTGKTPSNFKCSQENNKKTMQLAEY